MTINSEIQLEKIVLKAKREFKNIGVFYINLNMNLSDKNYTVSDKLHPNSIMKYVNISNGQRAYWKVDFVEYKSRTKLRKRNLEKAKNNSKFLN